MRYWGKGILLIGAILLYMGLIDKSPLINKDIIIGSLAAIIGVIMIVGSYLRESIKKESK